MAHFLYFQITHPIFHIFFPTKYFKKMSQPNINVKLTHIAYYAHHSIKSSTLTLGT